MSAPHLGFRSLQEEVGPLDLDIAGRLPDWLEGALLRTGPALFEMGRSRYRHWFDGLAMLYRFSFGGGRVSYANRILHSRGYEAARKRGHIVYGEFGTRSDAGLLRRLATLVTGMQPSDNANVNVICRADGAFALTETPTPIAFDPQTLTTLGPRPFEDGLAGQITTAHPQTDAARGVQVNYLIECGLRSAIHVVEQPLGGGPRRRVASLPLDHIPYMHSFGMTERYVVLIEAPYRAQVLRLRFTLGPLMDSYRWHEGEAMRFHLVDRADGRITTVEGEPCFALHQTNCFEDGEELVVDLCGYPDARILGSLRLDRLRGPSVGRSAANRVLRYRLPKAGGTARVEEITPLSAELPRINEAAAGQRYRSVWAAGTRGPDSGFLDRLVHLDVERGDAVASWEQEGSFVGEPVFIPRPGGQAEADGVVVSLSLDATSERSALLVLDARDLALLARAELPHVIPFDFHGHHIASLPAPAAMPAAAE